MLKKSKQGQAMAPDPIPITSEAFEKNDETDIYWLGSSGVMINTHGTVIMIDPAISILGNGPVPISEKEGAPYLVVPPIDPQNVEKLDAVFYTHADDDHMPHETALALLHTGCTYYGTEFVKNKLIGYGIPEERIKVIVSEETYDLYSFKMYCTLACHPWQIIMPEKYDWEYRLKDCCGFKFFFDEGVFWAPGDSILLDEHLKQQDVDMLVMDFCDGRSSYHFGTEAAVMISNAAEKAEIIPYHYGTYDLPNHICMNTNPDLIKPMIENPDRFYIAAPGEKLVLKNRHK